MSSTIALPGFAVVTGAASGIGQAIARALVAAGVSGIALVDVDEAGLKSTQSQLFSVSSNPSGSLNIRMVICDCTLSDSIEVAYDNIRTEFGRIDYSIHCAGIHTMGDSVNVPIANFDHETAINYRGAWLCQRSALTVMRTQSLTNEAYPDHKIPATRAQRGSIVNIGSVLSSISMPNSPAYCGSKAAMQAVTRSDALDFAADRVRVNAVLPGVIDTPMTTADPAKRVALEATAVQKTPFKRFGTAEEIADVVVFLCGSGASFVTGACWIVDGGYSIH